MRMSAIRRLAGRLSYANVVATAALFISLGGVSYAAFVLPPHSVGPRQLRARAIEPNALSFPLAVAGITDSAVEDVAKTPCDGASPPHTVNTIDCAHLKTSGISTPGREVHLSFRSPGRLLVSAIAGLRNEGAAGTSAYVTLHLVVDGRLVDHSELTLSGGQSVQAPVQLLLGVPVGRHTVGIVVVVGYSSYDGPGDVIVSPVSLVASAFPPSG